METEQIIEGNKLIADSPFSEQGLRDTIKIDLANFSEKYAYGSLRFHSSWDWQIPVYSKLAHLLRDIVSEQHKEEVKRFIKWTEKYESTIFVNNPEQGFNIIIEGINWYNQQSK